MHGPIPPVAYVPMASLDEQGAPRASGRATFVVRTSGRDPLVIAATLRQEVSRAGSEFRVSTLRTQQSINDSHTLRERVLAVLSLFFSIVALMLAGIGLYGVLHYAVLKRRREIGIRMALGARAPDVARRVTLDLFLTVLGGSVMGGALGLASERLVESLLYGVKATHPSTIALPSLAILLVAVIAAVPAVIHAVRIDPVGILRSE
jgi:putative ABC transport system permease protein